MPKSCSSISSDDGYPSGSDVEDDEFSDDNVPDLVETALVARETIRIKEQQTLLM